MAFLRLLKRTFYRVTPLPALKNYGYYSRNQLKYGKGGKWLPRFYCCGRLLRAKARCLCASLECIESENHSLGKSNAAKP